MVTRQTKALYRRFIQGSVQFGTFWLTLSESCVFHDAPFRDRIRSRMDQTDGGVVSFPTPRRQVRPTHRPIAVCEFIHATLPSLTPLLPALWHCVRGLNPHEDGSERPGPSVSHRTRAC